MTVRDYFVSKLTPSPDAFSSTVGEGTVLLQIKTGVYFGLDEIGTLVWKAIQNGRPLRDICDEIAADYAVSPEVVERDARELLADMEANGIVVVAA